MSQSFKILSIDGGGIRGIYSAYILYLIEKNLGINLNNNFDMITGTSTGSIIASGLALEIPSSEILVMYEKHGAKIFSNKFCCKFLKSMVSSIYDTKYLKKVLANVFGDKLLGDITKPLLLPSTDIGNGCVHILKSNYSDEFTRDMEVFVRDAVLASCSAPIYFDPHKVNSYVLADGGLWANNPALIAVIEAQRRLKINIKNIKILSIGTGHAKTIYGTNVSRCWGLINGWKHKKFIDFMLSLQSQSVYNYLTLMLDKNQVLRIDFESDHSLPLDDVSKIDDLKSQADRDYAHKCVEIKNFFGEYK